MPQPELPGPEKISNLHLHADCASWLCGVSGVCVLKVLGDFESLGGSSHNMLSSPSCWCSAHMRTGGASSAALPSLLAQLAQFDSHETQANLAAICCQTQSSIPCSTSCCYSTQKWQHGWETLLSSTRGSILLLEPSWVHLSLVYNPQARKRALGNPAFLQKNQYLKHCKCQTQPSSGSFANVPLCFQLPSSAFETNKQKNHTSNQHFPYFKFILQKDWKIISFSYDLSPFWCIWEYANLATCSWTSFKVALSFNMKHKLDVHRLAPALCNVNTCTYVLNSLTPLYVKFQTPVNWL